MTIAKTADTEGLMGPILSEMKPSDRPTPMPACGTCPKAMWYRTPTLLRAFCREIRHITWQTDEKQPIEHCDGREAALMSL